MAGFSDWIARARLIIERHGRDVHVCVIEHIQAQAPMPLAAGRVIARSVAEEFLRDRRGWPGRFQLAPRQRLMFTMMFSPFRDLAKRGASSITRSSAIDSAGSGMPGPAPGGAPRR